MSEAIYASSSHRQNYGYRLASLSDQDTQPTATLETNSDGALLQDDGKDRSSARRIPGLLFWCYALHVFLVILHIVLVGMLFTHPEHQFSVSVNNTTAVIVLKVFLQGFYSIYTAVLVFITRRLAISASMSKRQSLTAVHDISGAWNGIGASINTLWQQTKIVSAPSAVLLTLTYLGFICGLHIISSSVIQFEAFNNTITSSVPSTLTWPSSSVDLSAITWDTVSPLMYIWPLLSTAKGLSGATLYDVPGSGYSYTGAIVNATNLTANCGLLSNLSVGMLNFTSTEVLYDVNVTGFGDVTLLALEQTNLVAYTGPIASQAAGANNSYIGYAVTPQIELGDLITSEVAQATVSGTAQSIGQSPVNISVTSYFVACTVDATSGLLQLPMQNGRVTQDVLVPISPQSDPWTIWSPNPTTNLTQIFYLASNGISTEPQLYLNPFVCQEMEFPIGYEQCCVLFSNDIYINQLLGSQWTYTETSPPGPPSNTIPGKKQMENAVAQMAATYIWLAGATGSKNGGFQYALGESTTTDVVLQLRLNVDIIPVVIGLAASLILLVIVIWMFYSFHPINVKKSVTSSGSLELIWVSAHSQLLQQFMKTVGSPIPDHLRLKGIKAQVCFSTLANGSTCLLDDNQNIQSETRVSAINQNQPLIKDNSHLYYLCFILHGIFLGLHVVLIILLKDHPEHSIVMETDNLWATTILAISLQAFYTLYTAGLVFVTQQLAVSAMIATWCYVTAVHDVSQAWSGIGAAVQALWKQIKTTSSIWSLLGVTTYLACISILHITSATIMQFTAFNSTSTIPVQTLVTWPNSSVIANGSWAGNNYIAVPTTVLSNMETTGLVDNTIYDIVNTTNPAYTTAIVNATSIQVNCGLVSNLTFSINNESNPSFSFPMGNFGNTTVFVPNFQRVTNQIVFLINSGTISASSETNTIFCDTCNQYLFCMITTNVELDQSIANNTLGLNVNIANDDDSPIMAYVAACGLSSQSGYATLDLQTSTLDPNPSQPVSQPWKLWTIETEGSSNLTSAVSYVFDYTNFGICPQYGFSACSTSSSGTSSLNTTYTITPNQIEQPTENSIAAMIWIGGKIGPSNGGFEWTIGESQVTQLLATEWRLNINQGPVIVASIATLILFIIAMWLIGIPFRAKQSSTTITGISLLETLWIAAHSPILCECMKEVDDPSLDNLREAGMFKVCLGGIQDS